MLYIHRADVIIEGTEELTTGGSGAITGLYTLKQSSGADQLVISSYNSNKIAVFEF